MDVISLGGGTNDNNAVCGVFQVSASRSDIEEAEENAEQDQLEQDQAEEGLFDMVTIHFPDQTFGLHLGDQSILRNE